VHIRAVLGPAKQIYVWVMRKLGVLLSRIHVLGSEAPPLAHRKRHWAYSLTHIHDSMALAALDVPWWTYSAIDAVTEWIDKHGGTMRVYEYGSGASTFWLARRVAEVHSVEHHRGFGDRMLAELAKFDNVSLRIIEPVPSTNPAVPSHKEQYENLDFDRYVSSIDDVEGNFDLIVIDGRAREACLAISVPRLNPGGLIVFDNSLRRRYRKSIEPAPLIERRYRGLTPTLPYPDQTSLLTRRD
jgi:hypothetical protein